MYLTAKSLPGLKPPAASVDTGSGCRVDIAEVQQVVNGYSGLEAASCTGEGGEQQ